MALQALWDVTQQFNNKNGSILTSGKIYIYYQGRTALATTYHDEDGTVVNSNPIRLDNNGRATAFADPIYSYTIVVCDYYGKELFSQDITLHDAISTAEDVVVIGTDGTVLVDRTQLPNGVQYDLSVNTDIIATKQSVDDVKDDLDDLTVIVNNHTTQIGQLQDDVEAVENALTNKKDKQTAKSFDGAATKTVKKITQNANGEVSVEFEDIDLPPEVPNVEITSPNRTIDVQSSTDVQTNTKTFTIDVHAADASYMKGTDAAYGVTITNTANTSLPVRSTSTKGNDISVVNGSVTLKKGVYFYTFNVNLRRTGSSNIIQPVSIYAYNNRASVELDRTFAGSDLSKSISGIIVAQSDNTSINISVQPLAAAELIASVYDFGIFKIQGLSAGQGTSYTAGSGIDISNDVISLKFGNDIQYISPLFTDFGNDFGVSESMLYTGDDDELVNVIARKTVKLPELKAGSGVTLTKSTAQDGTKETTISMNAEVSDVVETVNKLSKDIDSKLTTNFDMAQIVAKYDFAASSVTGLSNGATMLYQAFTIPINNNIRIISAEEEEPTLLGIYATQNYNGKIMLAIYQYDFESGYTQYIGDTGPVTVNAGRNEYPLRHINPDITELSSGNVYYAALYLPSTHNDGLNLVGCPGYSQTFNSTPRLTMGTQNILYNNAEIDMTDATTGRLDYNDGNSNYYIGPWLDGYNESNYACPRFFLQLRNGTFNEPIIVNVPFTDIGAYTLDYQNGIPDVFGDTSALSQSSDAYPIFQTVIPLQDVDITEITLIDGNATHSAAYWNTGAFNIHSSDFSTRIGNGVTATITDSTIATSVYSHKYTLSAPIHLTANTTYRFPSGYVTNLVSRVCQYATPTVKKTLFLMDNIYYASEYSIYVRANAVQGTFLKIKDSNNNEYVI